MLSSVPFFTGTIGTSDGLVLAKTEVQGGAPISTDYFGCGGSPFHCNVTTYGMHLYNGTSWSIWSASSVSSGSNPPYLHTYENYWGYKTCPSSC
jgi:hypothetical protein